MYKQVLECIENSNFKVCMKSDECEEFICNKNRKEFIKLQCNKCTETIEKRIDNILESINKRKDIVCTSCKEIENVNKFLKRSNCVYDVEGRLCCLNCKRRYDNDLGYFFKCYCAMKKRKREALFYDLFYDIKTNETELYKEYSIEGCSGKNYDMYMTFEDTHIFIEIDDSSHFSNPSSKDSDFHYTNHILTKAFDEEEKVMFIRINDSVDYKKEEKELKNALKDIIYNYNEDRMLIICKFGNEYRHITKNLPDNIRVIQVDF